VPDPHPPSRPLPPPPKEDRQQKPATPPTGAASHQQPLSTAPQPQQRNSHIFKPMVRSLLSILLFDFLSEPCWNLETCPDKWTAICRFPSNPKKGIHVNKLGSCPIWFAVRRIDKHMICTVNKIYKVHLLMSTSSQISNVY
jgi:hypothetical protein